MVKGIFTPLKFIKIDNLDFPFSYGKSFLNIFRKKSESNLVEESVHDKSEDKKAKKKKKKGAKKADSEESNSDSEVRDSFFAIRLFNFYLFIKLPQLSIRDTSGFIITWILNQISMYSNKEKLLAG